jgi:hypothetical protein
MFTPRKSIRAHQRTHSTSCASILRYPRRACHGTSIRICLRKPCKAAAAKTEDEPHGKEPQNHDAYAI